jgi:hypothetical protein
MRKILAIAALLLSVFCTAQNVSINILTQNSGQVAIGSTVALEVTICNTDAAISVPNYKLRPRISVPAAIASIPASGHTLPAGWTITANTGSQITLSNATDQIAAGECRTILILMQGNNIGGPSTVNSNLLFSNGVAPGTATGTATPGDASSDNTSTSTIQVISSVPLTLINFSATHVNCAPVLSWVSENEQNTGWFNIERASSASPAAWTTVGRVNASGYTTSQTRYTFTDATFLGVTDKWLYRLKITDLNGRFSYSMIIPVSGKCGDASVLVYPNPVTSGKLFVAATGIEQNAVMILKAADGRVVYSAKYVNGINTIVTERMPAGLYILTLLEAGGATIQYKVIVR